MPEADRPLFADVRREAIRLGADWQEMASLRWQLARLELEAVTTSVKRLAITEVVAAVLALTALPVLVVGGAEALATVALCRTDWLLILGAGLLLLGLVTGLLGWWRFRRRFVGFRETLAEFRQDVAWLRDLAGTEDDGRSD